MNTQPSLRELHHPAFALPLRDSLDDHAREGPLLAGSGQVTPHQFQEGGLSTVIVDLRYPLTRRKYLLFRPDLRAEKIAMDQFLLQINTARASAT